MLSFIDHVAPIVACCELASEIPLTSRTFRLFYLCPEVIEFEVRAHAAQHAPLFLALIKVAILFALLIDPRAAYACVPVTPHVFLFSLLVSACEHQHHSFLLQENSD